MRETTATSLADIPADDERFNNIKERVRERYITFNGNGSPTTTGPVAHVATFPAVPGLTVLPFASGDLYHIDATGQVCPDFYQAQAVLFSAPPSPSQVGQAAPADGSPFTTPTKDGKKKKNAAGVPI